MRIERNSVEGRWLRKRWNLLLSMAELGADYTKWIVTGIAAIVAVILANLGAVAHHISHGLFKWGTSCLVVSLVTGAVSYLYTRSIAAGAKARELADAVEDTKEDTPLEVTPELLHVYREPFRLLLGHIVDRSFRKACEDPLYAEKSGIIGICIVNLLILGTVALAGLGLLLLIGGLHAV